MPPKKIGGMKVVEVLEEYRKNVLYRRGDRMAEEMQGQKYLPSLVIPNIYAQIPKRKVPTERELALKRRKEDLDMVRAAARNQESSSTPQISEEAQQRSTSTTAHNAAPLTSSIGNTM